MNGPILCWRELFFLVLICGLHFTWAQPPKTIPEDFLLQFTLNGSIPTKHFFVDDTNGGMGTHFIYSRKDMDKLISEAEKITAYCDKIVSQHADQPIDKVYLAYLQKKIWIYCALNQYKQQIEKAKVCVVGSSEPWIEAILIYLGADQVVTVEYNKLTYGHDSITTISGESFESFYSPFGSYAKQFDLIIAASSLDHDGLGRYGDPINPNGDIESIKRLKTVLKPTGLFFLTVPIGPDLFVYNTLRRYGKLRLPMLLDGWETVDKLAWDEEMLDMDSDWRRAYEPILVLRSSEQDNDIINTIDIGVTAEL